MSMDFSVSIPIQLGLRLNIKGTSQANIFFEILRPVLLLHLCGTHISLDPLKQMLSGFRALCKKIKKLNGIFSLSNTN